MSSKGKTVSRSKDSGAKQSASTVTPPRNTTSLAAVDEDSKTSSPYGYAIPDAKLIQGKYDIYLEAENDQSREEESAAIRDRAILDSIENSAGLIAQVEQLNKQLDKKQREVDKLVVLLEACEPVPGLDPEKFEKILLTGGDETVEYRDSKIVSLAKKVRNLTVAVNKEKALNESHSNHIQELNQKCDRLQKEIDSGLLLGPRGASSRSVSRSAANGAAGGGGGGGGSLDPEAEAKYQRELAAAQKTVEEWKRKHAAAVEESKGLSRALARELGEGVTVEQAVDGGWRGRAQQIIMLKSKIKKLEALAAAGLPLAPGSTTAGTNFQSNRHRNDVDAKAEEDLAGMSSDRKLAIEALTEDRERLIQQVSEMETKQKGYKARIKNLETEASKQKLQMQVLIDKTEGDDELIEALKEEVERVKAQLAAAVAKAQPTVDPKTIGTFTRRQVNADGGTTTFKTTKFASSNASVSTMSTGFPVNSSAASTPRGGAGGGGGVDLDPAVVAADALELQRLRRLCKQQAEQLNTQDDIIRQLRAGRQTLFGEDP